MAAKSGFTLEDRARMGPDALERKRLLAEALLKQSQGIQDIRHPMQGFAQMAQALIGNLKSAQADKVEATGKRSADAMWNELSASLGMGGAFPGAPGGQAAAPSGGASVAQAPVNPNVGSTIDFARAGPGSDTIRAGLIERGLPEHIADAFVMNFQDESGLNPGINETSPTVPGSRGGFGLAQWTGPRRKALEAFAAERGAPVGDANTQLDFLMTELQGPESTAAQSILSAPDTGSAAAAIVNNFLRPAESHRAAREARYRQAGGGGQQVASLDPSIGLPAVDGSTGNSPIVDALARLKAADSAPPPPAAPAPGQAAIAQALIEPNNAGNVGMPGPGGQTVQAQGAFPPPPMPQEWTPAAPLPQGGPDASMLMRAAGNEWMNPGQRGIVEALLGQKLKAPEPKKYGFQSGKDGSIFRTDPDTGAVEQVYGGKADLPTDVQEYEYARSQGYKGSFADFQVEQKRAGASQVNIDQKAESAFDKKLAEKEAETYSSMSTEGMNAKADIGIIDELDTLLQGQGGAVTGLKGWAASKGIDVGEATDDLQAANSLIKKLVPTQRQPGSGSMSDRDVELFTQSLPSLWNKPGGNAKIISVMRGLAKYKQDQGRIADAVMVDDLSRQEARKKLQALPNPLADFSKAGETPKANKPVSDMTDEELEAIINGD